jgi:alkanesulfonate monooxygenase SsuD/methylene tetrahydromethanopterin reductase-like flavin-dependent oxidoreductase (luciferase family)
MTYRNPDLLADIARTVDHVSGGRVILGVGSGWARRDYAEYGYPFDTPAERVTRLEEGIGRIRRRLGRLVPPPLGPMPLLVGAGGPRRGLGVVARHADMWNWFGTPREWSERSAMLDDRCAREGRDPREIERSVLVEVPAAGRWREYAEVGCDLLVVGLPAPFDLRPVERLVADVRGG